MCNRRGKLKTVAITAVARELAGFLWAVNREIAKIGAGGKAGAEGEATSDDKDAFLCSRPLRARRICDSQFICRFCQHSAHGTTSFALLHAE
jgi:hypothetical protein